MDSVPGLALAAEASPGGVPGAWCPDQYSNPDNVAVYAALAAELIGALPWIDALICSVGTGGHSSGVSRVLRQSFPDLRLVGVDTVGSTICQPGRHQHRVLHAHAVSGGPPGRGTRCRRPRPKRDLRSKVGRLLLGIGRFVAW
ncbi:pyridoxal-phosphate dependent enzyme [Actinomadura sp. K4S16]|uniref:pyridoxal-phosphate dependent enzyme n=1 Tax=Actinomadura sp. K4S16 TaxID=1316147 RepID=UPI002738E15D|nr:pyridoxal-phosphate dependent enzyme [Actinomadura sp. K4S16]